MCAKPELFAGSGTSRFDLLGRMSRDATSYIGFCRELSERDCFWIPHGFSLWCFNFYLGGWMDAYYAVLIVGARKSKLAQHSRSVPRADNQNCGERYLNQSRQNLKHHRLKPCGIETQVGLKLIAPKIFLWLRHGKTWGLNRAPPEQVCIIRVNTNSFVI